MTYVDGYVLAVPTAKRAAYQKIAIRECNKPGRCPLTASE